MKQLQKILDLFKNPKLKVVDRLDDSKTYASMYVEYKWSIELQQDINKHNMQQVICNAIQQQVPVDLSTTTCDIQLYKSRSFVDPNTFVPIFNIELIFNFPRS